VTSKDKQWHVEPPKVEFKNEAEVVLDKEAVEDEVLDAVEEGKEEAKEEEPTPEPVPAPAPKKKRERTKNELATLVRAIRKQDDEHNRTCAACLKRLPLEKFPRHKRSEVCEDCE